MKKKYSKPEIQVTVMESEMILAASASMQVSGSSTSEAEGGEITSGDARQNSFSLWDD